MYGTGDKKRAAGVRIISPFAQEIFNFVQQTDKHSDL